MKIAFLDRDGTIVRDYPDVDWKEKTVPEVLEDAIEGMKLLNQLGFEIIIVTNQYIINDGIIKLEEYKEFTRNLEKIFEENGVKVLDIFYCPHSDIEKCDCKKPRTGMIQSAMTKYPLIDLERSIMIGDSKSDEELAVNMNLSFYMVNSSLIESNCTYRSIKEIVKNNFK
jgi:D-glycero-D-manno-heptose 1,7-bisphosphate phosphatase